MQKETLVFKRMATKTKDNKDGVLYIHSWGTGFQELIFDNHEAASRAKALLNTDKWAQDLKKPA